MFDLFKRKEQAVWDRADTCKGRNPDLVRKDHRGNQIHRRLLDSKTKHGWSIEHIVPPSQGGSHHIRNLRAVSWKYLNNG